jgi:hypothetical protein
VVSAKHTPGPWVIRTAATYRSQIETVGGKGKPDVVARITTPRGGAEASDANAHLIAAAPDMLSALLLVDRVRLLLTPDDAEEDRWVREALDALDAAIKKARGEK